jgi:integrase
MWFATLDGKQVSLGITDPDDASGAQAAQRALVEQFAAAVAARMGPAAVPVPTVRASVAAYLARVATRIGAGTLRGYRFSLVTHFCAEFGDRALNTLTAEEIEDWARGKKWSNSAANTKLGDVLTWLKWAKHPLRIRRPPKESRGADVALTDEQFARVIGAIDSRYGGDLVQLLRLLRETGARPGEGAALTAEMIDWPNKCARLKQHKTRHRSGKDRVIYFNAAALAILEAQREKHGRGHLFRTRGSNQPYKGKMLVLQMRRVSARVGFRVCCYGLRHTFATSALVAGVPDAVVAELLGHKGTGMVAAHYGHLSQRSQVLRAAVERAGLTPPPDAA